MKLTSNIICHLAQERYKNVALWRNLWTILLWGFGAVLISFFTMSIFFFIRQDWLPAALVVVGTIVEGVGMKWIVDRRTVAVKEEKEAYQEVRTACQNTAKADQINKTLSLVGGLR